MVSSFSYPESKAFKPAEYNLTMKKLDSKATKIQNQSNKKIFKA